MDGCYSSNYLLLSNSYYYDPKINKFTNSTIKTSSILNNNNIVLFSSCYYNEKSSNIIKRKKNKIIVKNGMLT